MTLIDHKPAQAREKTALPGLCSFGNLEQFYFDVASLQGSSWFPLVLSESGNKF